MSCSVDLPKDNFLFCRGESDDGCGSCLRVPFYCIVKSECGKAAFECSVCHKRTYLNLTDIEYKSPIFPIYQVEQISFLSNFIFQMFLTCRNEYCGREFSVHYNDIFFSSNSLCAACPFCNQWNNLEREEFMPDIGNLRV
jgi:hypothetical protein